MMNRPDDQTYYSMRAATSRALAQRAAHPAAAALYAELANRYDLLAARPEGERNGNIAAIQAA